MYKIDNNGKLNNKFELTFKFALHFQNDSMGIYTSTTFNAIIFDQCIQ